jgi:hypothetical protein
MRTTFKLLFFVKRNAAKKNGNVQEKQPVEVPKP